MIDHRFDKVLADAHAMRTSAERAGFGDAVDAVDALLDVIRRQDTMLDDLRADASPETFRAVLDRDAARAAR